MFIHSRLALALSVTPSKINAIVDIADKGLSEGSFLGKLLMFFMNFFLVFKTLFYLLLCLREYRKICHFHQRNGTSAHQHWHLEFENVHDF